LTVTWGALQPKIILPSGSAEWADDRIRIVLAHELAHIRRGDWVAQMVAEILRAIYWFNPLVWIAARRLRHESEQACDDAVLALGIEGSDYATHLLDLARVVRQHRRPLFPGCPAPAMVRPSSLERRVNAMLNTRLNRKPPARSVRIGAPVGLLAVTMLIGGFGAAAQTFARFSGSVVDPMNTGIPRATLLLVNAQTQSKHEVRSDEHGRFEFVGLPAGEYLLEAQVPGFATLRGSLTVTGQDVQRSLAMQIGSLQETISVVGSRSPSAASEPEAREPARPRRSVTECTPSAGGGDIRPPRKLRDVRPAYPPHLQSAGVTGIVILAGRVGTDGFIDDVKVLRAPHAELVSAAVDAVRQWEFDATLLNCVPVDVAITVMVNFAVE
jgi:TonB family protein